MPRSKRTRRKGLLDGDSDQSPLSGVANIFDVAMVFSVALIVMLVMSYHLPQLLDPDADREGLLLHENLFLAKERINIARRMAGREDHGVCAEFLIAIDDNSFHRILFEDKIGDLGSKADFASGFDDALADRLDDVGEEIRSDVGMRIDEDLGRGTVRHEDFVNLSYRASLRGTSIELAVGEGAGAAFSKAVVGIFDDGSVAKDGSEVEAARGGILASFEDDGPPAAFNRGEGGKHAGGSAADDDDFARVLLQ